MEQYTPREVEWNNLVNNLRAFMSTMPSQKVILGLSRGFDSTMVAAVAAEALGGEHVLGVAMPSPYSADSNSEESRRLAEHLGIQFLSVPITDMYNSSLNALEQVDEKMVKRWSSVQENLQSRLRAVTLMALSNAGYGTVLNTGNLSERLLGYYTLYGDSIGAVSVLGNYFKTELWEIARTHNRVHRKEIIPDRIINAAPSAELAPGQIDEDVLGDYDSVDAILYEIVNLFVSEGEPWVEDLEEVTNVLAHRLPGLDIDHIYQTVQRVDANAFKMREKPVIPTFSGRSI